MSSNLDNNKLGLFIVVGLTLIFALMAGNYVADEDYTPIAAVIASLALIFVIFGLGKSIYLLIPISSGLTGQISVLPLPFNFFQIIIIISTTLFLFDIIYKRKVSYNSFEAIDLWIYINLLYLVTVFLRNPIGFAVFSFGDRVGGLPYISILLGFFAYIIISRITISPWFSQKTPVFILAISLFNSIAAGFAAFRPNIGLILGKFYSVFLPVGFSESDLIAGESRFTFLSAFASTLILFLVAKKNPLSFINLRNISFFAFYILAMIMIMLSGFRNVLISSLLYTILGVFIREKFIGALKIIFAAIIVVLAAFLMSYTHMQLPFTAQRALCFLPGEWDTAAVSDAEGSTEWRVEMWKIALTSPLYIKNKILGDGFGFARSDFERSVELLNGLTTLRGDELKQEMFLIDGDYHSGPVSTIRFAGYVGLFLLLPLFFYFVKMGYETIQKAIGTPYQFCAIYFGIPTIVYPFFFLLVFGDYKSVLVDICFNVGVFKMINASLNKTNSYQAD